MAKVRAPFKVSGKIGDFIFYNSGDHNYIRQAPWHKKTTGNYYKEYPLLFLNRYVFAGAIEASPCPREPGSTCSSARGGDE